MLRSLSSFPISVTHSIPPNGCTLDRLEYQFNHSISTTQGQTQEWKFYVKDAGGNWNETDTFSTTISDTAPTWSTTINDDTLDEDDSETNHDDIDGYCTDADSDTITYSILTEDTNKVDVTLTDTQLAHTPADNWNGTDTVTIRCTANSVNVDDEYDITVFSNAE